LDLSIIAVTASCKKTNYSNDFSVEYIYDAVDNIKEIWYHNTGETSIKAIDYTYTAYGQLYRFDDLIENTAIIYKYDAENRLVHYIEFDTDENINEFSSSLYYNEQGLVSSVFFGLDYRSGSQVYDLDLHYFHAYNPDGSLRYYTVIIQMLQEATLTIHMTISSVCLRSSMIFT
jgi:hypothetical protein